MIVWIRSHHLHLQWKFKLLAVKKHCMVTSTIFLFSKVCWQGLAMFCLYTSYKLFANNLNFHWRWRWWDRIQAIFWNLFYFKNEPLPFLCYACDYRTYTKFYMDQHEKVEHKTEDFTCETCGYKTKHQHAIKRHLKYVHDDSRNFQCEVCAKSVKTHK